MAEETMGVRRAVHGLVSSREVADGTREMRLAKQWRASFEARESGAMGEVQRRKVMDRQREERS